MTRKTEEQYADIIHLPHHVSKRHPQMSMADRAAQFSPFAALTGHDEAIAEAARITEQRPLPTESRKEEISILLQHAMQSASRIRIDYFIEDAHKSGGATVCALGKITKLSELEKIIIMKDGTRIPMDDIIDAEVYANSSNS